MQRPDIYAASHISALRSNKDDSKTGSESVLSGLLDNSSLLGFLAVAILFCVLCFVVILIPILYHHYCLGKRELTNVTSPEDNIEFSIDFSPKGRARRRSMYQAVVNESDSEDDDLDDPLVGGGPGGVFVNGTNEQMDYYNHRRSLGLSGVFHIPGVSEDARRRRKSLLAAANNNNNNSSSINSKSISNNIGKSSSTHFWHIRFSQLVTECTGRHRHRNSRVLHAILQVPVNMLLPAATNSDDHLQQRGVVERARLNRSFLDLAVQPNRSQPRSVSPATRSASLQEDMSVDEFHSGDFTSLHLSRQDMDHRRRSSDGLDAGYGFRGGGGGRVGGGGEFARHRGDSLPPPTSPYTNINEYSLNSRLLTDRAQREFLNLFSPTMLSRQSSLQVQPYRAPQHHSPQLPSTKAPTRAPTTMSAGEWSIVSASTPETSHLGTPTLPVVRTSTNASRVRRWGRRGEPRGLRASTSMEESGGIRCYSLSGMPSTSGEVVKSSAPGKELEDEVVVGPPNPLRPPPPPAYLAEVWMRQPSSYSDHSSSGVKTTLVNTPHNPNEHTRTFGDAVREMDEMAGDALYPAEGGPMKHGGINSTSSSSPSRRSLPWETSPPRAPPAAPLTARPTNSPNTSPPRHPNYGSGPPSPVVANPLTTTTTTTTKNNNNSTSSESGSGSPPRPPQRSAWPKRRRELGEGSHTPREGSTEAEDEPGRGRLDHSPPRQTNPRTEGDGATPNPSSSTLRRTKGLPW